MIPLIMIGLAALLVTVGIISLQIGAASKSGQLVSLGLMLIFLLNLGAAALLVFGATVTTATMAY